MEERRRRSVQAQDRGPSLLEGRRYGIRRGKGECRRGRGEGKEEEGR